MARPDDLFAMLVDTIVDAGLPSDVVGERRLMTVLEGQWKRTIPVLFEVGDRTLRVTSLLAGRPDERHDEVHAMLLHRNERAGLVHFALDDEGAILVRARIPLAAVDPALVGELLGEMLTASDEVFNSVLRTGFGSYLAAEQAWRAARGMPPNPVADQG